MPRGELGAQDRFDPDAAKDAERARQLLRSLLAEDMARAAGKDGQKPFAATPASTTGAGPPASPSTGSSAASTGQSVPPRRAGEGAPALGQQFSTAGSADSVSERPSARTDSESRATDRNAAADNEADSAAAARYASHTPVDGERTRALIASLVREISPYLVALLVLYVGFLALKAWLKRGARKPDRSGRKRRNRRQAEGAAAPEMEPSPTGEATVARN